MKKIVFVVILFPLLFAGCATAQKQEARGDIYERAAQPEKGKTYAEPGSVVVRAKRFSRIEMKRHEAVRKNNKDTVCVVAATVGAILTYFISDKYFRAKTDAWTPAAVLGLTAAGAYTAEFVTGAIYDGLNPPQAIR